MKYLLETERLMLREFVMDDHDFILQLVNSPGWLQFIGDRNIRTVEQAKAYLENGPIKSYHVNGFGLSLVVRKTGNLPIGMCGILRRENLDNPDIGFALLPEYSGMGYAHEIVNATITYAKDHLKIPVLYAITMVDNLKSVRLIENLGMKLIKSIQLSENEEKLQLYQLK